MKMEFELVEIPESDLPEFHHKPSPWFSPGRSAFLLWTARKVWELPLSQDHTPRSVELTPSDRTEFLDSRSDGFQYFAPAPEEIFSEFDPLRLQVPVEQRFSGAILVCDKRTIRLCDREVRELGKKSVPRPITAKTAATQHPWILVGDNNGEVRRLTLESDQLGRLERVTVTKRPVRDLLLTDNDQNLFVAGMGELQKLKRHDNGFQPVSSVLEEKPPFPIERICLAEDGATLLATSQMPPYRQFALISLKR